MVWWIPAPERAQFFVLPRALHGLGGVGKCQLAVEYVVMHPGPMNRGMEIAPAVYR